MKAHCLFEQSGTFKRAFQKMGIPAEDYDILNDFGETDHKCDLFEQINIAYGGGKSVFDNIVPGDLILAFFPCTYFECQQTINFRGQKHGMECWSKTDKLEYAKVLQKNLTFNYNTLCNLILVCIKKNLSLIIENPATKPNYLDLYFPIRPTLVDIDRRKNGDYFKKPTQYWFVNIEPKQNIMLEEYIVQREQKRIEYTNKNGLSRSMIAPEYADRFIKEYIL